MRQCNRLHLDDLERGDTLRFKVPDYGYLQSYRPTEFDATVRSTYRTANHGLVIEIEPVKITDEYGEEDALETIYVEDGWDIRLVT